MIGLLTLIIVGGTAVPTSVFGIARALVYRQTDPARGEAYLQWFREEKYREQHARTTRPPVRTVRRKELVR